MTTSTDLHFSSSDTAPSAGGGFSGRNSLAGFDLLHLLGVLAAARQTGALRIERPDTEAGATQHFAIWLREGRVVNAEGPHNLQGAPALAELLRRPEGTFLFKTGELTDQNLDLSTDHFGYQALLLLPPPPLPFTGAAKLVDIDRLNDLGLTPQEAETLEDIDLGMPLSEAADTPQAQAFVARLHKLGLLTRRRLRVARMVVQLTHSVYDQALIDADIYQAWCKVKGEKLDRVQMRLDSGQEYLIPVVPRKNMGAFIKLPPDILIRTGLCVGTAVYLRPEPFEESV